MLVSSSSEVVLITRGMLVSDKVVLRRDGELDLVALGAICIDVRTRGGVSGMLFMLNKEELLTSSDVGNEVTIGDNDDDVDICVRNCENKSD